MTDSLQEVLVEVRAALEPLACAADTVVLQGIRRERVVKADDDHMVAPHITWGDARRAKAVLVRLDQALASRVGEGECDLALQLGRFREALAALPAVRERYADGQQFNAYESADNDEDDEDGGDAFVCIGPIASHPVSLVEAPIKVATLIEAALQVAQRADQAFPTRKDPTHEG